MGKNLADVVTSSDWIAKALQSCGYAADFTPGSLWEIERFLDEQTATGAARPGGLLAEGLGYRLFALGAYVGEVIRRDRGGVWISNDDDPQAEINVVLKMNDGGIIWPVQRVLKRFKNGREESLIGYGAALGLSLGPDSQQKKTSWLGSLLGRRK